MADIATVVAKLKAQGIQGIPNPSQIAQMPGLSQDEKALAINAIYTGQFQSMVNSTGVAPASTFSSQIPTQATQQRDNPANQVADVPSALFGGVQPSKPIYIPTQEEEDAKAAAYQKQLDQSNPFKGMPAMPVAMAPAAPIVPPVKNDHYIKPRESLSEPTYNYADERNRAFTNSAKPISETVYGAGLGNTIDKVQTGIAGLGDALSKIFGGQAATQPTLQAPDVYTPGAAPALPDYSQIQTPTGIDFTFKRNPFTKEGQDMAKNVYAPQYQTLDRLRESANNQYGRSDKVIEQLYKGLADDVLASKKTRDAEYDKDIAATTTAGNTAANSAAQGYDSGSKIAADLMHRMLGADRTSTVNPSALTEMATARGQSMAGLKADAQKAANIQRDAKTAQGDYAKGMGEAYQTQGAVSRENLINQLNGVLGDYGNQELNLNSQERASALSLAQQLSDWDWSSQQANYQTLQDKLSNDWQRANWDRSNVSDAYNNQWQQYTTGEQGRQFASQQEWQAYQQALQNQMDAAKLAADQAAAAAKAGGTVLDPSKYGSGAGGAAATLYNYVNQFMPNSGLTGDDIQKVLSAASGFLSPRLTQYTGMVGGQQKFIDDLLASQPNLPTAQKQLLRVAADEYWNSMLKTDRSLPSAS